MTQYKPTNRYSTLPGPERYEGRNVLDVGMRAAKVLLTADFTTAHCALCTHSRAGLHGRRFPGLSKCKVKGKDYCTDVNPNDQCDQYERISVIRMVGRQLDSFTVFLR